MTILFLSTMFSDIENDLKRSKHPNSVSGHKFQENLVIGFEECDCDFSIINVSRIRSYPDYPEILIRKKRRIWGKNTVGIDIGFINLPILNYISQIITGYRALSKEIKKNETLVLLTFNSNYHTIFTMLLAKRLHKNVILCNVVGDLHGRYGIENPIHGLKGKIIRYFESVQDLIAKKCDTFVFLSKYMADAIGVNHKPFCVVECLYSSNQEKISQIKNGNGKEKIIFYAGSLCKEYGIEHLLRAFTLIKCPDYQLWIAGQGEGDVIVQRYADRDRRIKFLGLISPMEVEKNQQIATILVSPRTTEHEFVKYSFASKTAECLASGKPYVAHKLPCDLPEYGSYICYADSETDQALARKLEEICSLTEKERNEIGAKAQEFILTQKNPKVMCQKIVDMLKNATARGDL